MIYPLDNKTVWVAGHQGLVGSAIVRLLESKRYHVITAPKQTLDLTKQHAVDEWIQNHKPHCIVLAAAKVGGIQANLDYPAQFIYENLMIQSNVIHAAYKYKIEKLLFLGSSCIYPKNARQPIKEDALLSGSLEASNDAYSVAKIAGIKMCQVYRKQYDCDFISLMPTNLYGPNDNYESKNSHVIAALIKRFHEARLHQQPEISIWGSGAPLREFMHVDDLARACVFSLENYASGDILNVGTNEEISIQDLAMKIAEIVGYQGRIINDLSKPDGVKRKLLDCSKINKLGWQHSISLEDGLRQTYRSFCNENNDFE